MSAIPFPGTHRHRVCANAKRSVQLLTTLAVLLLICVPAFAQTSQGTIQGAVFDQSGAVVAGATITISDVARGFSRVLTTDGAGQYVAPALNPGTYTVRAEAKGFRNVERGDVLLEVGQTIRIDLVVQPGEQTQTITVTGEVPAVDTSDATLGGTVTNQSISELPLNGRNFERLLDLRPGNVSTPGAGTGSSNTNGRRISNNSLRMEGIMGVSNTTGSTILNASYRGGDSSSLVPIDAIQEFNSMQNPKAEYGFRDGYVINLGIKSGTNSIHGAAYAFGRDAQATDAANVFTARVTPANFEQFGASAGGPILKDKLFWFANFEGVRDVTGNTATTQAPIDIADGPADLANCAPTSAAPCLSMVDACMATVTAGKAINPLSAQLAGIVNYTNPGSSNFCVPQPAVFSPLGAGGVENLFPINNTNSITYLQSGPTTLPLNNGIFKADYVLGPHHHLSGLVYISKSVSQNLGSTELLPQYWTAGINNGQQYSGSWTWTPNSTLVNDFRLGYVFIRNQTLNGDVDMIPGNPWPSGYSMPTGVTNPLYGGLTTITFSSFSGVLGANARTSSGGPQGDVDLVDTVSYLRGRHTFKFGFEYINIIYNHINYSNATGSVLFSNLQNYLQGTVNNGSIPLGNPAIIARSNWFAGFAQDDWRIKQRLTLNLGLRYEIYTPVKERFNYIGNFDPSVNPTTTPAIQVVGSGEPLPSLFKTGLGYLEPRFGVAWDVRGDGKTVVRAAGSMFVDGASMSTEYPTNPFGANFPSIGVNNSGTDLNAHTYANFNLTGAQVKWNSAANLAPGSFIFPTTSAVTINNTAYTGLSCTFAGEPGLPAGFTAAPCQAGATDPNFSQGKSVQWNVDVQRAITNRLTVDVAYVGVHGYNEEVLKDLNQPAIGAGWPLNGANVTTCITPPLYTCKANSLLEVGPYSSTFPYLSQIDEATTGAYSNYNALQATLQARGFHGLTFLAGYTYSHTLDIADAGSTLIMNTLPSDSNNIRSDYGNASYDLPNRFIFSPTYQLPGRKSPGQMLQGWSVNAILTLQSGEAYTIADLTKTDWLGTNEILNTSIGNGSYQFWNYVGPNNAFAYNTAAPAKLIGAAALANATCLADAQAPYAPGSTYAALAVAALFNAGCFMSNGGVLTPPAYGTLGDASRGSFFGPNYRNLDFSVDKIWKFKERYSAEFRLEFFNFTNHGDFGAPGTDPSKSSFGFATGTPDSANSVLGSGGPRHIQFGLKLGF